MPNRILREGILTSERVNELGWPAEVFYRRLMSVVDDFGRYYAHPSLIRAACYPLQLDKVSDSDIGKWLLVTGKAGLVRVYPAPDGKRYLELLDFRQHRRAEVSKFPQPPPECSADASQMQRTCSADAHLDVDVDVDVDEFECVGTMSGPNGPDVMQQVAEILGYLNRAASKGFELKTPSGKPTASAKIIAARLKEGYTPTDLKEVVFAKCEQWAGDEKMSEFLRPQTLFGRTKFQQYFGEIKGG